MDGAYRWTVDAKQGFHSTMQLPIAPAANIYYAIDARQTSGADAGHGLVLRSNADSQYFFGISNSQYYILSRLHEGQWTTLIPWTPSASIHPWETNRLAVIAVEGKLILMINDQYVNMVEDDTIPRGRVGLAVGVATGNSAAFEFDNLQLIELVGLQAEGSGGATPTPLAIQVGGRVRVASSGVALRESPRTDAAAVGMLSGGAILEVIGGPQQVAGLTWWRVRTLGNVPVAVEGWALAGIEGSVLLEAAP